MVSHQFENTSNTGVQVMTIPFFVADKEDYKIFTDTNKQQFYTYLYNEAIKMRTLDDYYIPSFQDNKYSYYHDHLSNGR